MSFSMNEVEAQAKKAARGAGYSWGLAEDAGKAVRWLCGQGIDGVAELASLLQEAPEQAHCALTQGTRLADAALRAPTDRRLLPPVTRPVFLFPFIAAKARQSDRGQKLAWETGEALIDGLSLSLSGDVPSAGQPVTIEPSDALMPPHHRATRATPDPVAWDILTRFAHRTYAPATEESRRLGAGDTQSDAN